MIRIILLILSFLFGINGIPNKDPTIYGPFYIPILSANDPEYFHAKQNINHAVGLAVKKVREYHQIELYPKYLMSNCDASKAINKIAAVLEKSNKTQDRIDDPVAFVGFACDAEFNVFADLAEYHKIPIIATGVRKNFCDHEACVNFNQKFVNTVRVGVNTEMVADLIIEKFKQHHLFDIRNWF